MMEEKKTSNKFGEFLKAYRTEEKNMSLRDFADLIGISFSHLSKIERGEHVPSKTTVSMIANALGLEKDKLFLLAGYVSENYSSGLDAFFPYIEDEDEDAKRKAAIIDKIKKEFPDADLMFNDLASFTADDMQDVYDYIKFKKSQKEIDK
ncbi:helix-turn-helix domain-containing protein [Oceanobacillus luteolus]|uniref:helix-turn-helix domain-containing protein n=1 Tax=Oceanobacillus luteolus TaxID=1274358 RepID=UPI00203E29F9|nr:helix-turn-helix transcriptional regulator [Oceanobacillus luteolus]MCM3739188.1 helix-turn-helix domain-containing protein [Oceanobacillus luteolus]